MADSKCHPVLLLRCAASPVAAADPVAHLRSVGPGPVAGSSLNWIAVAVVAAVVGDVGGDVAAAVIVAGVVIVVVAVVAVDVVLSSNDVKLHTVFDDIVSIIHIHATTTPLLFIRCYHSLVMMIVLIVA